VSVFVEVDAGEERQLGRFIAKLGKRIYNLIVSRTALAAILFTLALAHRVRAQDSKAPAAPPGSQSQAQPQEVEPPEEDKDYKPRTYDFNPLKASKSITAGDFYFKKGNYAAAKGRYVDATLYDPGSAEAFEKLGDVEEKLHDVSAARVAYAKCIELDPKGKDVESVKKRLEKLPPGPSK